MELGATTVLFNDLQKERELLAYSGRLHWYHWLIVVASALVTVAAWHFSKLQVDEKARNQFAREAAQVVEFVKERMLRYEDALLSGVAAIEASGGEMNVVQWRTFAGSLHIDTKYPGINGIGVIGRFTPDELQTHIAEQRRRRPEYSVHPAHNKGEHWPIIYIEPEEPNAKAVGLDMAHETNRFTAALRARDEGTAQITGPIVLVQDEGHTPGFLFYAPYYTQPGHGTVAERRENFVGLVYAPFVVKKLMAGTLDQTKRRVGFRLSDNGNVLYDENTPRQDDYDADPQYTEHVDLELYGRTWRFDIQSTQLFRQSTANFQPWLILLGGITIDALLLTLFVMLTTANRRTLSFADRMNVELRNKATALAKSNAELESFAYVASHDLKTPLRGIADLADFLEEDLGDYLAQDNATPDVCRNLERLREQTGRMENLIEGIMNYSSVGASMEATEIVDVESLLKSAVKLLHVRPEQVIIDGALPVFETYRIRFEQVINNLVGNAFKYNPDKDNATVTVACRLQGCFYSFSISDNGPGIDPKFHARIFDVFQTLQPKDDIESTGVGLSIVKKSVEALGGSVRVSSIVGEGTTFTFEWPMDVNFQLLKQYGAR